MQVINHTPETQSKIQEFGAIMSAARRLLDGNMIEHAAHARAKLEEAFMWAERGISIYCSMQDALAAQKAAESKKEETCTPEQNTSSTDSAINNVAA